MMSCDIAMVIPPFRSGDCSTLNCFKGEVYKVTRCAILMIVRDVSLQTRSDGVTVKGTLLRILPCNKKKFRLSKNKFDKVIKIIIFSCLVYHSPVYVFDRRCVRRKEGNILFNDALNTFCFTVIWRQTYGNGPFR